MPISNQPDTPPLAMRRPRVEYKQMAFTIRLNSAQSERLEAEARRRGIPAEMLAAEVLGIVATDDLFKAVLD